MAVVTGDAGREAADIIQNAQQRQIPMLTVREASRRAGISPEGWNKVIKTGRGRVETVIAMARVVGAEDEVRAAAGMSPALGSPQPVDADAEIVALRGALSAGERWLYDNYDKTFADEVVRVFRERGIDQLIRERQERRRTGR